MAKLKSIKHTWGIYGKYVFNPIMYLLISGDYEDLEEDNREGLLSFGVEEKSTALVLISILFKTLFQTILLSFNILLGRDKTLSALLDNLEAERNEEARVDEDISEGKDFNQQELIGCSFVGANLEGADFKFSFLTRCDFRNANLKGAQFNMAEFRECDFTGANIEGAVFEGVEGRGVKGLNIDIEEL